MSKLTRTKRSVADLIAMEEEVASMKLEQQSCINVVEMHPLDPPVRCPDFYQHFSLEQNLGDGSYGTVHKIRELATGRLFALKIFKKDPTEQDKKEITLLRLLSTPPTCNANIVCFFNVLQIFSPTIPGRYSTALIMEYIEGLELYAWFTECLQANRLPPRQQVKWTMLTALKGLISVHAKNVVHNDIKLENIMLRNPKPGKIGMDAVLIDFGLSYLLPFEEPVLSTPNYRAPELSGSAQVMATADLRKVDIWALGCTCWELITGNEVDWMKLKKINGELVHVFSKSRFIFTMTETIINWQGPASYLPLCNFVLYCLTIDNSQRPTAEQAALAIKTDSFPDFIHVPFAPPQLNKLIK